MGSNSPSRDVYRLLAIGASVCVTAVITVSVFIIGPNALFITGALTGCLLAVYKAVFWWNLPAKLARPAGNTKRPVWALLLNVGIQLMTGAALLAAAVVNTLFFYGMAAGMLAAIAGTVAGTLRSKAWRA